MFGKLRTKLKTFFATGLLVILPTVITIFLLWKLLAFMDNIASPLIRKFLGYDIQGLGVIVTLLVIFLVGMLTANVLGRRLVAWGDSIVGRIPLVRFIYLGTKQLLEAASLGRKNLFREAVLVEYPRKGIYALGFVPAECKGEIQEVTRKELVNVFIFTTPNPTSGMLIMVPKKDVIPLKMSVEEGLKLVISGGIITPSSKT